MRKWREKTNRQTKKTSGGTKEWGEWGVGRDGKIRGPPEKV